MHLQKFQDECMRQSEVAAQVCVHLVVVCVIKPELDVILNLCGQIPHVQHMTSVNVLRRC